MNPFEQKLRAEFPNAPESFFRRQLTGEAALPAPQVASGKRIRQDAKPLMNKLEQEWFDHISAFALHSNFRAQSKRFKLGNGIWFKPDITAIANVAGREYAWEVKGPFAFRGGFENLKVAAGLYPEIVWVLVWKEDGEWKQQRVLP